jgi:hypothetical protein
MIEPELSKDVSRRCLLRRAACAVGAVAASSVAANNALAQAKSKKEAVDYQDSPKGDQQCSNCMLFEAPTSCKVVEGQINQQGWCKIWVKKG